MGRRFTLLFIVFLLGILCPVLAASNWTDMGEDIYAQNIQPVEKKKTSEYKAKNQQKEFSVKVYTSGSSIVIETEKPATIDIYSATGLLRAQQTIDEGITYIPLSKGIYIVNVSGKAYKVMVNGQ